MSENTILFHWHSYGNVADTLEEILSQCENKISFLLARISVDPGIKDFRIAEIALSNILVNIQSGPTPNPAIADTTCPVSWVLSAEWILRISTKALYLTKHFTNL